MKNRFKTTTMQNQEKIIQAIAAYLERETLYRQNGRQGVTTEFLNDYPTHSIAVSEYAHAIAAVIAPHLESGVGWEDAPDWAEWRTVDKNGQVTFWENHPHAHLLSKYWCDDSGGNRKYCEVDGWQYKIEQRPR